MYRSVHWLMITPVFILARSCRSFIFVLPNKHTVCIGIRETDPKFISSCICEFWQFLVYVLLFSLTVVNIYLIIDWAGNIRKSTWFDIWMAFFENPRFNNEHMSTKCSTFISCIDPCSPHIFRKSKKIATSTIQSPSIITWTWNN